MHEMSLFKDILEKIEMLSKENEGKKITRLQVRLGVYSHLSAEHFREHFNSFSVGTAAEGADLEIIEDKNENAEYAQSVLLENVEIEM